MNKLFSFSLFYLSLFCLLMYNCTNPENKNSELSQQVIDETIQSLSENHPQQQDEISKGVRQAARLWNAEDGTAAEFQQFCVERYIADPEEKKAIFLKISDYLEAIYGHYNQMVLGLRKNTDENTGPLHRIDEEFAAFDPSTHLSNDLYTNKLAFEIILNFPKLSLEEKEKLGNNRLKWAYARLGDIFTSRIPADLQQALSQANSDADVYIAKYNIYAGKLLGKNGEKLFPEDMILLSHWNLRDEIKANYNQGETGLQKQETIYEVMKRIISQEIPANVINSGDCNWDPYTNRVFRENEVVKTDSEGSVRYQKFLNNFKALQAIDRYTGETFIQRTFSDNMEISVEDTEALLRSWLSSAELKKLGGIIESRIGRKLQPFDIWYDGFKPRSSLNEEKLSEDLRKRYPGAQAFKDDLSGILIRLGFTNERAKYLAEKVDVDGARGSGHAWGAAYKGMNSHLRTRIPENGMDYKGYNIAIHEFGHNVEQTISLYDVDYYMMNGVPNTAFTEALAFLFQKRDLDILGIQNGDPEMERNDLMDKAWHLYEISGVSLLDIEVWKWLYANREATSEQLKEAVIRISKEIWNEYYAPVFGVQDETVLAVYSHMVSNPLYLNAYAFGQIIEFQLEQYMKDKNFAQEVDRIFRLGRLTPNQWMLQATGTPISTEPITLALREIEL